MIQSPTEPWPTAGMRDEISHRRLVTLERRINRNRRIPDRLAAPQRVFWRARSPLPTDSVILTTQSSHGASHCGAARRWHIKLHSFHASDCHWNSWHWATGARRPERFAAVTRSFLHSFLPPRRSASISDRRTGEATRDATRHLASPPSASNSTSPSRGGG